jgi:hypothetical protein
MMRKRKGSIALVSAIVAVASLSFAGVASADLDEHAARSWGGFYWLDYGDHMYVYDRASDGHSVRVNVTWNTGGGGSRSCTNSKGADSVEHCDWDLPENTTIKITLWLYEAGTGTYVGGAGNAWFTSTGS